MKDANVVILDDDQDIVLTLTRALKAGGLEAKIFGSTKIEPALDIITKVKPEVVVLDLCLEQSKGTESGFSALQKILNLDPTCRVLILTGHSDIEHGIRAIHLGASNFLSKPADIMHLNALIQDAIVQSQLRRAYQEYLKNQNEREIHDLIVGESPVMREVISSVQYASQTNQAVLLIGETGTGKGVCASAIHKLSKRRSKNFVRFQPHFGNADMVHSDLFGHVAGSFTGAEKSRSGLLLEANQGTFFLDEVDEVPLETQIALLGVLQDKKYRPIGSDKIHEVDIRLITATNQNIEQCIQDGKVRQDFYHRIAHFTIEIPPLRERKSDLPLLADRILKKFREQEHFNVFDIDAAAINRLAEYDWPGNVRELEAVIEGGAYHAQYASHTTIAVDDIKIKPENNKFYCYPSESLKDQVHDFKRQLVKNALDKYDGNQVHAAKALGIDRATLRRILS